jgi:hypothetical protein
MLLLNDPKTALVYFTLAGNHVSAGNERRDLIRIAAAMEATLAGGRDPIDVDAWISAAEAFMKREAEFWGAHPSDDEYRADVERRLLSGISDHTS